MLSNARDEQPVITPEQARQVLADLPEGTYTLRDVATRWPERLTAAMVLCDEATRMPRAGTFRTVDGPTILHRSPASNTRKPTVSRWQGDAFSIHVQRGQPVRVTIVAPDSSPTK
jgi:hypothetical protein